MGGGIPFTLAARLLPGRDPREPNQRQVVILQKKTSGRRPIIIASIPLHIGPLRDPRRILEFPGGRIGPWDEP